MAANIIFVPINGGLGARLTCSGTTSRVELPDPTIGSVWCINVTGTDYVSLRFGNGSVEATLACLAFPPGLSYIGIPSAGSTSAPSWMAGITSGATIDVQISAGNAILPGLTGAP